MSDDPRGHDDGDVFVGTTAERDDALDFQFKAFLDDLAVTEGYSPIPELLAGCHRAIRYLRSISDGIKR
jgi:hypothetical protein